MTYDKKSLAVSGTSGILIAVVMIASIALVSLHPLPKVLLGVSVGGDELLALEGPQGVSQQCGLFVRPSKIVFNVTIFEFTKPLGSGSEADMVMMLTSKLNYSANFNVTIKTYSYADADNPEYYRENYPAAIRFLDGCSEWSWMGNVEANETKTLNHRLKAVGTGLGLTTFQFWVQEKSTGKDDRLQFEYVFLEFKIIPNNIFVTIIDPYPMPNVIVSNYVWPTDDSRIKWFNHTGVGSELNLTTQLWGGRQNATNVTWRLVLPEGIVAVEGPTVWTGNVTGSLFEPAVQFYTRLKFVKTGTWIMYDYVEKDGIFLDTPQIEVFEVTENDAVGTIGL